MSGDLPQRLRAWLRGLLAEHGRTATGFGLVGVLCMGVSYVVFVALLPGMHYLAANLCSWAAGVGVNFLLNRSLTFGLRGRAGRLRQLALFLAGSVGQLALSSILYVPLLGWARLDATLAFLINTGVTAAAMYAWLKFVAFRRRPAS